MDKSINFSDIIKDKYLSKFVVDFSEMQILITIGISFLIGLFIFYMYKKTFKGVVYSKSFSISLIMMTCITALMIMAITSNIVLSLGMVGALSIVRFRTAVKDPIDIVFMFWSITIGIIVGAGIFKLAILGTLGVGLIIYIVNKINYEDNPYLLVVQVETKDAQKSVVDFLSNKMGKVVVKSKVVNKLGIELTLEVKVRNDELSLIDEVNDIENVTSAVLLSYNGDYVS